MTAYVVVNSKTCSCERAMIKLPYIQISAKSIVGQKTAKPLHVLYLSIKDLEILAKLRLSQILHLCTQKSVCATNFGLFGKIGANLPVQLSSRSHFAYIENKKIIPENQFEKHKNLSLSECQTVWIQTVCKCYQQMTKVANSKERIKRAYGICVCLL